MEVNLNSAVQGSSPASSNNAAGVSAPQRADVAATRPVSSKETANLENKASNAEQRRFDAVRSRAATYVSGANSVLNDIKFTIYSGSSKSSVSYEYVVKFTDVSTGAIETKTEAQLFQGTGGGDLVSGQV